MDELSRLHGPEDLRSMSDAELDELAEEIRRFLIEKVAASGGHLGPNLGVVELTLALHRVFDSPRDPIIWDTGHQAYVHKIVTGRADRFDTLRRENGLSGYPSRAESEHDIVESSHASAALSYADGLAKAFELTGHSNRHVVAVVGDGALTGGMCWEALNNIAAGENRSLIIVVNDNGRSYAPTIGGFADHLAGLRLQPAYEKLLDEGRQLLQLIPMVGDAAYTVLRGIKAGLKDALSPQVMFTDLGIKYVGPVDGHDRASLESAFRRAMAFGGPVIVHAVTRKGMGYSHAENDSAEQMHSTGVINPHTGRATSTPSPDWTSVFSKELVEIGERDSSVVAITAAMPGPTGLAEFGRRFPDRMFDVGIAEQHAITSAAGLALGGLHPVVAIYSTFLNRAFDQVMMDVALLEQPVTIVLDRAGITGPDGASHNGMWDMSLLGIVPGMRVAAPRDPATLREELREAVAVTDGPTVVRFPKGSVCPDLEAVRRIDSTVDVLAEPAAEDARDVLLIAIGPFARLALDVAETLRAGGINATVVDPRWVLPVPEAVVKLAADHRLVVTVEDGGLHGGIGSAVSAAIRDSGVDVRCREVGLPQRFYQHASRDAIHKELGLTAAAVAARVQGWLA
ncbi:1-deoxy-D-xylulose-5-phosphate synthase [Millisia brevis]|uniref:1-deoxy-D-xylulose-5-phosphate synthase n=1 Tax=Millisia brevis TaxID=264148 RepID=UPI000ABEC301|nr:1-deoxy-D-xylulose-5-phosphate synthase [Millisia brevis]